MNIDGIRYLSLLETQNISFSYPDAEEAVLRDISLKLSPGDFLSIVGPSGSGKSTLLRLLAGHLDPDAGQIRFHEETMEGPEIRLVPGYEEIKLVHQHFELGPNLTLRGNLTAALSGYTPEYRQERVDYLIDFFSLKAFDDHFPRNLSGGQQQRLAIAMAMANEPEVLLMDEPFSALDPLNAALCLAEVRRLAKESKTAIVLVTHDVRDAMIADEMMVLIDGAVRQQESPRLIYRKPKSLQVARLLGPVNELSAEEAASLNLGGQKLLLRVEDVEAVQDPNGSASVIECMFRGAYQVVVVLLSSGKQVLAMDFSSDLRGGEMVLLKSQKRKALNLSD